VAADATVVATIAAVIAVDALADLLAVDVPAAASNGVPVAPAGPGTIAVIKADAPARRADRNLFPKC
jgi:hypothetical protein